MVTLRTTFIFQKSFVFLSGPTRKWGNYLKTTNLPKWKCICCDLFCPTQESVEYKSENHLQIAEGKGISQLAHKETQCALCECQAGIL